MDGDVQFEEEDLLTVTRPASMQKKKNDTGLITRLAISTGLAKDEQSAQVVLLIAAVALLVFAVGFYVVGNHVGSNVTTPTPEEAAKAFHTSNP